MPSRRLRDLPLPVKLSGLLSALLLAISVFMLLYFPGQMSKVGQAWAERRAIGMSNFIASAIAPALEFDDPTSAQALVDHLSGTYDARYGVVLNSDGQVWVAWKKEAAPGLAKVALATARTTIRGDTLDVVTPIQGLGGSTGTLLVGFSLADLQAEVRHNREAVALVALLMFVLALAASSAVGTYLVRPIRDLTRVAAAIVAAGDLTQEIRIDSRDEVGMLAESFRQLVQKLRTIPESLRDLVDSVVTVVDTVAETARDVAAGADVVDHRSRESTARMEVMLGGLRGIAGNVEVLQTSAEQSTKSNLEMVALHDAVAPQVVGMTASVNATSGSIQEMSSSIHQVSDNIERLNSSIEETSLTMNEMDASIRAVEANAKKAVSLSSVVAENATSSVESVRLTLDGIEKIRTSSALVSETIRSLGGRISHIGKILGVINDVADQTKLLALNAAIIAAHSGESGRAFGVVADEIKQLAKRVGTSTAEIGTLISTIQGESEKAVAAVDVGMNSVAEGVVLGRATAESLTRISQSVHESTAMIEAIADATVEQARSSSQVTSALRSITDASQKIHTVSRSQSRSSEEIALRAGEMQKATRHVEVSAGEQRKRSQQIATSMGSISDMVRNLNTVQQEQTRGAEQVVHAFRSVQDVASGQSSSVHRLEQALASLKGTAEGLRKAVRQFRV